MKNNYVPGSGIGIANSVKPDDLQYNAYIFYSGIIFR